MKSSSEKPSSGRLKLGGTKKPATNEDTLLSDLLGDTTQNKKTVKAETSREGGWNTMKDSFVQDDNWTEDFFQTESTTVDQKVCSPKDHFLYDDQNSLLSHWSHSRT